MDFWEVEDGKIRDNWVWTTRALKFRLTPQPALPIQRTSGCQHVVLQGIDHRLDHAAALVGLGEIVVPGQLGLSGPRSFGGADHPLTERLAFEMRRRS